MYFVVRFLLENTKIILQHYNLYRLYISNATNPPNICAKQYGTKSFTGNFPTDAITIDTAGFICPPENLAVNNMANAKAAPIAKGFPVAKITYTKNVVPKNSAK